MPKYITNGFASWTPTLTFATPGDLSVVYSGRSGQWSKVGRMIHWSLFILTSTFTHTTASGNLRVTGLPFTASAVHNHAGGAGSLAGYTKANYTQITPYVPLSQAYIEFFGNGSAQAIAILAVADMPTGGTVGIRMSGYYLI